MDPVQTKCSCKRFLSKFVAAIAQNTGVGFSSELNLILRHFQALISISIWYAPRCIVWRRTGGGASVVLCIR